jgi:cell division septum initiation protein DivIVA
MAADKKKIQEIADLLDKIQKNYNKLGEKNPFRGMNPNTVKDVDNEILKLEASLQGVQDRVDNLDMSFTDLTGTLKEIVKEINPRMFNATKEMQKGMKGLVSEASKLADEEADISLLSEKQLKTMLERAKKSKQMAQDNAAEILKKAKLMDSEGNLLDSFLIKQRSLTEEQKSALKIVKDEGQETTIKRLVW